MTTIDLSRIVQEWVSTQGVIIQGSPKFSALKLELSRIQWNGHKQPLQGKSRSFEMNNQSPARGTGHLQTIKEGRPITQVTINSGVIQGYPKWTVLEMPSDIMSDIGQKANIEIGSPTTQRVETSMLQVDAEVTLSSKELKYATVENTDFVYKGRFTGIATLSGKVLFENIGQIPVVQIFKDMGVPDVDINFYGSSVSWNVSGEMQVNFEDNQKLLLQQ